MTSVLGLDLSLLAAGIAVITDDTTKLGYRLPETWPREGCVWPTTLRSVGIDGRKGDGWLERNRRIRAQTRQIVNIIDACHRADPITMAAIEAPLEAGQIMYSYGDRFALFHAVLGALDYRGIPFACVVNSTGHAFTTGKGRVSDDKAEVLEATRRWWPGTIPIADHNIGDAVGLGMMAAMREGMKPPFWPGARHHSAVHTVTWPGDRPRPPKPAKVKPANRFAKATAARRAAPRRG